jgi:hypothetical protein
MKIILIIIIIFFITSCQGNYNENRADTMNIITHYYMRHLNDGNDEHQRQMMDSAMKYNKLFKHYLDLQEK